MKYRYLPYTLLLHAPTVLTSLGGDPNSARTLPFIPGSALRGAVARALGDPGADAGRQREFRALILDGNVRFLNAYPRAGGRRALPTPASFRTEKDAPLGADGTIAAFDLAAYSGEIGVEQADWPSQALSTLTERFVSIGAAQPLRVQPKRGSQIHQQRHRPRGRAWKDPETGKAHGTIFVYEFLDAGQEFDGLVLIQYDNQESCDEMEVLIRRHLATPLLLGRSRRSRYGGDAEIEWWEPREREIDGDGLVHGDIETGTIFRTLLTSAYIGRNSETGQIDPAFLTAEITEALSGRATVTRQRCAFDLVGGFNRKWRLEVPQALACAAGSNLLLEATSPIPFDDLLAIEHAGLGERRAEGFGRAVFLEAPKQTVSLLPVPDGKRQAAEGEPPDLVRFAEGRILEGAVARAIEEEAARLAQTAQRPPTSSLLGRLRNAMRAAPETALDTIRKWLAEEGADPLKRPAMNQLTRCRIGKDRKRLADWLREMARVEDGQRRVSDATHGGDGRRLAGLLRLDAIEQRFHVVSQNSARALLNERDAWIRARVIDCTLAALTRRQRSGRS